MNGWAGKLTLTMCLLCLALTPSVADQLVSDSVPRNDDRVTFRVPISALFADPLELDSDGDGEFTRVDSVSIEGGSADIAVAVNDVLAANRVRLEKDDDGDPGTPGGNAVLATAAWELKAYPPLLKITPDSPLDRDSLYRLIVFEGGTTAARRVSDQATADEFTITFRTLAAGATGSTQTETFVPPSLGYQEVYNVYLPPGYGDSPTQTYPAVYLLHGGFGNEGTWIGTAQTVINRLVDQGDIEPVIAVTPDGNSGFCFFSIIAEHRLWSNTYDGQYLYGDYATYDLPADVEARFNVESSRQRRAVAGMSMGGFGAASVGLGHTDEFSLVAPLAGWQHSVRMVNPPPYPSGCGSTHWEVVPDFGDSCPGGIALQGAFGPPGTSDLTHLKTINGRDLALTLDDAVFRGNIFISHGDADETATVQWSDDTSCALEETQTAHCYKRPVGVGHDGSLWNVALEEDVLPRFNAIAYWTDYDPALDADCVNATTQGLADTDRDGIADDGDRSGTRGDAYCVNAGDDCDDNCRDTPNVAQLDFDVDGQGDACDLDDDGDGALDTTDCDPLNASAGTPPAVASVAINGNLVDWSDLASADTYDVARGLVSTLSAGDDGACVAEGITESQYEDLTAPPIGNAFFYLVRAEDADCGGVGPWGADSEGDARIPICGP